jgi:hypothetical protein
MLLLLFETFQILNELVNLGNHGIQRVAFKGLKVARNVSLTRKIGDLAQGRVGPQPRAQ